MFKYNIRGENIEITEAIRNYVKKRVDKIQKYFNNMLDATVYVNLKIYTEKTAKVEVTIPLPHLVLRAEETNSDLYASVDLVIEKLERQIRKYKTKMNRKHRNAKSTGMLFTEVEDDLENVSDLEIVRTKRVFLKPMDSEEAVLQMNMLGHDFFVYNDAETNETSVIYRRTDGKYGLIETK
ncbi:MAG: ribosome-associated translation inhibitor RaiA [Lactobacillales bacterium]|jgi:ribosomal subunit interface protein|nr:ribosome-associated translation inhibitor RaiA [Lactobacillales bacterium]